MTQKLLTRLAVTTGWLVCIVLLGLWLVEAIHRGRATGEWIAGTGLAALVIIPLMAARLRP